ncbi:DUF1566 domain-containing protein [Flavivirga sp. 57AJ16]|uniref:Lcl C-terminal domain-containing protein n=1 Tax=Flavivirga sp. 57AJ16 TaxID=3025307 RepID=UPI0023662BA7|nr:DUF1566 domain-containing protein [Flavivirga sp. 57AJ16]MDD7885652.1 DUF1566 domain-containing protein [Flavivirga sp. 57AJ16]
MKQKQNILIAFLVLLTINTFAQSKNIPKYTIGQNVPALGGIIFYLDSTGQHGLVCAPEDQSTGSQWHYGAFTNTKSYDSIVGSGKANTAKIIVSQGVKPYAAELCYNLNLNGFTDWYLPSKKELSLMFSNIGRGAKPPNKEVGNFASDFYWSSTELDLNFAWAQYFLEGNIFTDLKNHECRVRAVRSF